MLKIIYVYNKDGRLIQDFQIDFLQRNKSEFQLDPEKFYQAFGKKIPDENIELMIHESSPFTILDLIASDTHVHQGNDGNMYICYPLQIISMEEALDFAINWCLLTTFHLNQKADIAWFESFGRWMVELTVLAMKDGKDLPKPFAQFPLWIQNGRLGWRVEVS
jgi:hypothetical protein